jgi:serine-type D-Ala-D-Ala carboxypeptidase/endopeptidase (penicillin-binding protein 4)
MRRLFIALFVTTTPGLAQTPAQLSSSPSLKAQVEAKLAEAATGTRFGLVVADNTGREIISIAPDNRFIPASNTKMVTTAAAYTALAALDAPDADSGARVVLVGRDVILIGRGDARLSSRADCKTNCLTTLADAIAAKTKRVRDIIGDASAQVDQRWSPGMSWNNVAERSGTAAAALTLDDNEAPLTVKPGAMAGDPPQISGSEYFMIDNRATTIAEGPTTIDVMRLPFERVLRVIGNIAVGASPDVTGLGIDDPAHYAAWRLAALLKERDVRVKGQISTRYIAQPGQANTMPLAQVTPPPLAADIVTINKISQNLHADLLLRRLPEGLKSVESMMTRAGVQRTAYDFADGSGMSTYNRMAPRGTVTLLRWIATQPWSKAWRASLPIGGVDGTLARRFKGTALEGRIFAKTGGLNATAALSGYMTAKSGHTLTFSMFANDMPEGTRAQPVMDATLLLIASAN